VSIRVIWLLWNKYRTFGKAMIFCAPNRRCHEYSHSGSRDVEGPVARLRKGREYRMTSASNKHMYYQQGAPEKKSLGQATVGAVLSLMLTSSLRRTHAARFSAKAELGANKAYREIILHWQPGGCA
jgi:hypothetical protein